VIHRVDVELAGLYCRDHFIREVELLGVGAWQQNALLSGETVDLAHPEEALNLLVHAANGLHIAELVDRTGHGEVLIDGLAGEGGEQGTQAGQGGAVTIDLVV
jgi:hypothetical protein